jgi:hypothetical protein
MGNLNVGIIGESPSWNSGSVSHCFNTIHGSTPLHSKYKFMETQMLQQKKSLMQKVPDIQTALRAVDFLIQKKVNFASILCLAFPCLFIDPGIASLQQCIFILFFAGGQRIIPEPV